MLMWSICVRQDHGHLQIGKPWLWMVLLIEGPQPLPNYCKSLMSWHTLSTWPFIKQHVQTWTIEMSDDPMIIYDMKWVMCNIERCDTWNLEHVVVASPCFKLFIQCPFNPFSFSWAELKPWLAKMTAITLPTPFVFCPVWQSEMIAVVFMISRNGPNDIFLLKLLTC